MPAALRPSAFFTGRPHAGNDIKDLTWLRDDGSEIDADYFSDPGKFFIAWQLDAKPDDLATRIYVAYNGWVEPIEARLPALPVGEGSVLVIDTSAAPEESAETPVAGKISVAGRSVVAAIARWCQV